MAENEPHDEPPALHELEAEVMEHLWARGEATVREVMESLNAVAKRPRAYTTYLTICQRLDSKGLLLRRREGRTDVYIPRLGEEEYARARAGTEVGALVEQFGDAALVHFARHINGLEPNRRRRLSRLARGD